MLYYINDSFFYYYHFRFQQALKGYGVADVDVFQTVDLYEKKDISQVTTTLFALGRTVRNFNLYFRAILT
jgi:hypothetical protein